MCVCTQVVCVCVCVCVFYFDILPDSIDNVWSSGCVHSQKSCQFAGQFVLNWLQKHTQICTRLHILSDPEHRLKYAYTYLHTKFIIGHLIV